MSIQKNLRNDACHSKKNSEYAFVPYAPATRDPPKGNYCAGFQMANNRTAYRTGICNDEELRQIN